MILDEKIQSVLKDFYSISGIRVSLHDNSFKEIYSYPRALSPFCECNQTVPNLKKQCSQSDADAFLRVKETNEPYVYKCKCGLYEAVAPIYNYGRLTGYLMLGQVRDNNTEMLERTVASLRNNGIDSKLLDNAYNSIMSLTPEKLNSYINIMTVIAEHFTLTNKFKTPDETLANLVNKEIIRNHSKALTLEALAQRFGCSISTLTTAYKKEYKISIHQFIINTRLNQAKKLLITSNKPIKEISEECGFYDQNHFYRSFKKIYNVSPGLYRSLHNNQD